MLELLFLVFVAVGAQDCDLPFQRIGEGCYFYDETLYIDSFTATVDFCNSLGAYPVIVKNGQENRDLIEFWLPDNLLGDVVILGATRNDLDIFEWVDGTFVRDTFDHWNETQPDGTGDCAAWSTQLQMFWDDIPCGNFNGTFSQASFICEKDFDGGVTTTTTQGPTTTASTTQPPPAGCPAPFVELSTGCYYASETETETWTGARLSCEFLGGYLAVITSGTEQETINNYLYTVYPDPTDDVWIGLFDEAENNVFVWIDGSEVVYTYWADGEPDGDNQDHGFLSDSDGWRWGNELSTVSQFYVCEAEYTGSTPTPGPTTTTIQPSTTTTSGECVAPFSPVDDGCYYASLGQRESWTGAGLVCEGLGGQLAVISTQQEQQSLTQYLNTVYPVPTDDVWIGGHDALENDEWVWVDGTQVVFTAWGPGEPDPGNQDHMYMSDNDGWLWGNELNTVEQFYLCEQI